MTTRVYLDHNAGAPLAPAALAVLDELRALHGNPSSAHLEGRRARALLEDAREQIAACLGVARDSVLFTSGGTESNALALRSAPHDKPLAVGATEHPSVLASAAAHPAGCVTLPVGRDGRTRPEDIATDVGFVSVSTANHETGHLQDVESLARRAHDIGVRFHTDASQAVGRTHVDAARWGVDFMTVTSHKLGGPVGVGALFASDAATLVPLLHGGAQEGGARAGTESARLAAAFAAAVQDATDHVRARADAWSLWNEELRSDIARLDPTVVFHSPAIDGLSNTLCVSFPGRRGASLVHRLDIEGVAVSHGSACSTGSLLPSPVLLAMGYGEDEATSALRISWGHDTPREHLHAFVRALRVTLNAVSARDTR